MSRSGSCASRQKSIASFGVTGVRVNDIECGPVVTRVNLVLPRGVKIKAVTDLANDLAMQLKVKSVSFTEVSENGVLALDMPAAERFYRVCEEYLTAQLDRGFKTLDYWKSLQP